MQCQIYKSLKRQDTYVYLKGDDPAEILSAQLQQLLGRLEWVMALDLSQRKKLANADIDSVIAALKSQSFYLQIPDNFAATLRADRSDLNNTLN